MEPYGARAGGCGLKNSARCYAAPAAADVDCRCLLQRKSASFSDEQNDAVDEVRVDLVPSGPTPLSLSVGPS